MASFALDDDPDLDDAALWAVIDSAAAAALSSRQPLKRPNPQPSPHVVLPPSPQNPRRYNPNNSSSSAKSDRTDWRPQKAQRSESCGPDMAVVKRVSNATPVFKSPEVGRLSASPFSTPEVGKFSVSPFSENRTPMTEYQEKENFTHCLSGRFPTVSLFKDYQDAALAILEKSDYTMISGNPFIKKSGWRKIAFYFNISFEIRDKTIEFDNNRDVQRAEFVVRAHMQGGRFSDGWGSCERREKRFNKPNNDIPSTAETRAKNKACQDLVGIGAYRSGAGQSNWSR